MSPAITQFDAWLRKRTTPGRGWAPTIARTFLREVYRDEFTSTDRFTRRLRELGYCDGMNTSIVVKK